MSEPQGIYDVVPLPVTPVGAALLACRICGALVIINPSDYTDLHLEWHARRGEKTT